MEVGELVVGGRGSQVRNRNWGARTRTTRGKSTDLESGMGVRDLGVGGLGFRAGMGVEGLGPHREGAQVRNSVLTCVGEAKVNDICPGPTAGAGAAAASA